MSVTLSLNKLFWVQYQRLSLFLALVSAWAHFLAVAVRFFSGLRKLCEFAGASFLFFDLVVLTSTYSEMSSTFVVNLQHDRCIVRASASYVAHSAWHQRAHAHGCVTSTHASSIFSPRFNFARVQSCMPSYPRRESIQHRIITKST